MTAAEPATPVKFGLPRTMAVGAIVGGLSCLFLAGLAVDAIVQLVFMALSAIHWVLLADALRCGVWVRDDGLDIRLPLQPAPTRLAWRELTGVTQEPTRRGAARLVLHTWEDEQVRLPRLRDQERLAAIVHERTSRRSP